MLSNEGTDQKQKHTTGEMQNGLHVSQHLCHLLNEIGTDHAHPADLRQVLPLFAHDLVTSDDP